MLNFHKRFTHNQIRAALVLVGLFLVVTGSSMIYAYLDRIWGMMALIIGIIVAGVGALIITLELTGLRRVLAIGAGFVVLAAGLALMVPGVPGPGIPLAIVGLAILASEFKWAENLYNRLVEFSRRAADKVRGKKNISNRKKTSPHETTPP